MSGFSGIIIWVTTTSDDYGFLGCLCKNHVRDKVILFDRVHDLQNSTVTGIPSDHGYRGDVVYSHAKLLMELIVRLRPKNQEQRTCLIRKGGGTVVINPSKPGINLYINFRYTCSDTGLGRKRKY